MMDWRVDAEGHRWTSTSPYFGAVMQKNTKHWSTYNFKQTGLTWQQNLEFLHIPDQMNIISNRTSVLLTYASWSKFNMQLCI